MRLAATGLTKRFGVRTLFERVGIRVEDGERVGLVGPNGAGKSTLLRILAGLETPDEGQVVTSRGTVTAVVPQLDRFEPGAQVAALVERAARTQPGEPLAGQVLAAELLGRLGFDATRRASMADALSGGWKKRLSLAIALASAGGSPDLLFLDEPTNHLDLPGLLWLEDFLLRGRGSVRAGAVVFVTHDRTLLDRCATRVVELSGAWEGGTFSVEGGWTAFGRRREEALAVQAAERAALASVVREDDRWLSRGPEARRTKAKGRIEDAAERREALDAISTRDRASRLGGARIDFHATGRKTRRLIVAERVAKGFTGRPLFRDVDLELIPGSVVGLVGPNGSGKTTLMRVLRGELTPDAGRVVRAEPEPRVVAMTQMREAFAPGSTLAQAIAPLGESVIFRGEEMHVATWARRFLFRDDQLRMPVERLSGGELARAHIARMMLEAADVLLLDEPTNDLDIPTLLVLEEAVRSFPGATLLVSHDRTLLGALAASILVLGGTDGRVVAVASIEQAERVARADEAGPDAGQAPAAPASAGAPVAERPRKARLSFHEVRELDGMEEAIGRAEAAVAAAQAEVALARFADHLAEAAAWKRIDDLGAVVEGLYTRWAELEARRSGPMGS